MKVSASIKKRCAKCKIVKRQGRLYVICETRSINSDKDKDFILWHVLKALTSHVINV